MKNTPKRITVLIADMEAAIEHDAPVSYRTVSIQLTPEQSQKLTLRNGFERYGQAVIEGDEEWE